MTEEAFPFARRRLEVWHRRFVTRGARNLSERILFLLLLPFGWIYGLVGLLRTAGYRSGLLNSYRASVPVVSIGNLAVGGTGKTPVVDYLLGVCFECGLRPAVVSRGYGGTLSDCLGVVCQGQGPELSAAICGDEPHLLARRNPEALIIVARKRALGVQEAEARGVDIILMDDGFQHLAVQRDIDLVLLDARAPFGNGQPLPTGLLREFRGALSRADMLMLTRSDKAGGQIEPLPAHWKSRHRLADYGVALDGRRVELSELRGKRVAAFAGIADPDDFFQALEERGLVLMARVGLGDHAAYDAERIDQICQAAKNVDYFLTTEKDGVKLVADSFPVPCLQLPVMVEVEKESEFRAELQARLEGAMKNMKAELLEILACPKCKEKIRVNEDTEGIQCESCRLEYPVRDGIPVMLIDEAEPF